MSQSFEEITAKLDRSDAALANIRADISRLADEIRVLQDQVRTDLDPSEVAQLKDRLEASAQAAEAIAGITPEPPAEPPVEPQPEPEPEPPAEPPAEPEPGVPPVAPQ